MTLEMRGLDPCADIELFREAYDWRENQKLRHVQHGKMSFEQWSKPDPSQVVMGLFNWDLIAAYLVIEYEPGRYDMHYTSRRDAPREHVVAGGIQVTNWLVENGALEVSALIIARNRPLRRLLEDCGYSIDQELTFSDSPYKWLRYVAC